MFTTSSGTSKAPPTPHSHMDVLLNVCCSTILCADLLHQARRHTDQINGFDSDSPSFTPNLRWPHHYSFHSNLRPCFCPRGQKIHRTFLGNHHPTKNRHWPINLHHEHGCCSFGRGQKDSDCKRSQPPGQSESNSTNENMVVNSSVHDMRFV